MEQAEALARLEMQRTEEDRVEAERMALVLAWTVALVAPAVLRAGSWILFG